MLLYISHMVQTLSCHTHARICVSECCFSSWQVCDWLYPLMASDSPVLLCNTGVFMFPDMMAPAPGYYVGVVLSSELPAADRALFEDLLSQMTDLRVQVSSDHICNSGSSCRIHTNRVDQ